MSPPEAEKLFRGRWRIVETSTWDRDALDDVAPAHITFGARHAGELALIAIQATLDYRVRQLGGESLVEFTWSGFDDGTEVSGRGWGGIEGDSLVGEIFLHLGDETTFVARREG